MSRRLVIAGALAAALAGGAVPAALAATDSPITVDTSNGVRVGVHSGNTPIAGASVTPDGQACVGISLQLPVCTPGGIVGGIEASIPQSEGPVTIDTSNGVAVGVHLGDTPVAGASVSKDGKACVGISLQLPVCVGGVNTSSKTRQKLPTPPVVVRHDDTGTAVGVGDVGVIIEQDGSICPVVSTQNWRCIHTS